MEKGDARSWRRVLTTSRLRANGRFELVLTDALPDASRQYLADRLDASDVYGVLLPHDSDGQNVKTVCRETALLYLTLAQPAPLPSYVARAFGDGWAREVAALVLDGVLEIESGEGRFVSGADASDLVARTGRAPEHSVSGRLSKAALRYGYSLPLTDPGRLAARLYFYNREPLSPSWRRRFASRDDVAAYLGLDDPRLDRCWKRSGSSEAWHVWRSSTAPPASASDRFAYKLYVSPRCRELSDAFPVTVRTLTGTGALALKVGANAVGLLRPDKIVAYFTTFEDVQAAAAALLEALAGCPAQGVPFAAVVSEDGLVSWGMDPPASRRLGWGRQESWRLWVCSHVAASLRAARESEDVERACDFALTRLRLIGIDTTTWTPSQHVWGTSDAEAVAT